MLLRLLQVQILQPLLEGYFARAGCFRLGFGFGFALQLLEALLLLSTTETLVPALFALFFASSPEHVPEGLFGGSHVFFDGAAFGPASIPDAAASVIVLVRVLPPSRPAGSAGLATRFSYDVELASETNCGLVELAVMVIFQGEQLCADRGEIRRTEF